MPRFFTDHIQDDIAYILGDDAKHILKSLRMNVGEELTVCDKKGNDFLCRISALEKERVTLDIIEKSDSLSEPKTKLTIYQALPKGDKMELIIQKCVELGANKIVPIITERTISRPDDSSKSKKHDRMQRIALEAAKQSGRGIIPKIGEIQTLKQVRDEFLSHELSILFYENGGEPIREILSSKKSDIAVMIGSEGGFEQSEVDMLKVGGAKIATLGKRILRCETAPIATTAIIMYQMGEME